MREKVFTKQDGRLKKDGRMGKSNLKNRLVAGGALVASLATVAVAAGMNSSAVQAESIQYKAIIQPSLMVSIPTNPVILTLNPGTNGFDSQNINVNVATNNPGGYQMYMYSDSTALTATEGSDTIDTLPDLAGGYTQETFTVNHWGWNKDGGNWQSYNGNQLIMSSAGPTNGGESTIGLATKVDYQTSPGTYGNILNFQVIAPTLSVNMQDLSSSLCVTSKPTLVTDTRDGQIYSVQRLADGKCWMTQNLKLGKESTSLALTSADSDVSSFTLNNKLADGVFPRASQTSGTDEYYQYDGSAYYCTDAYGCYYNWYTATAGSGTGSVSTDGTSVESSICPKGWKLPTGGSGGEFQALATAYGGTDAAAATAMLVADPTTTTENANGAAAPGFLLGGNYNSSGARNIGTNGYYWSRTASSARNGYRLNLNTSSVNPANYNNKYLGNAVRCVLSES